MSSERELSLIEQANVERRAARDQKTLALKAALQYREKLGAGEDVADGHEVVALWLASLVLAQYETNLLLRALLVQGHEHDVECLVDPDDDPNLVFAVGVPADSAITDLLDKLFTRVVPQDDSKPEEAPDEVEAPSEEADAPADA